MNKIAVDAMGGDYAPVEIVKGAVQAAKDFTIPVVLVGDEEKIRAVLAENHGEADSLIEVHHASQVIEMDEHPGMAFRKKKDASVSVGARLVKKGECGALVAPGSTGAAVTAGLLGIGRISGVERPAILTPIPNQKGGYTFLIDSGASTQSKAERLSLQNTISFAGNAEGRDIMSGDFDVIVSDGFTGNVVLKFGEGAANMFSSLLKEAAVKGGLRAKIGAVLLKPALKKYLVKRLDYSEYGGAPLMGIQGGLIICHGASKARAIRNAVRMASNYAEAHVPDVIRSTLQQIQEGAGLLTESK